MMKRRKLFITVLLSALATGVFLTGCGSSASDTQIIKIGATAGPNAEILEAVQKEAKKEGINIEKVEFTEYIQPNMALDNKDLNMNVFQHEQFLQGAIKTRGYQFTSIGSTYLLPYALFSNRYTSFDQVPNGAKVAIPNDPTNGGRGLALLERAGLIRLKPGTGASASVTDVIENKRDLKIVELEAAQLPRSLNDLDVVSIPGNYVLSAGLNLKDALLVEDKTSPFTIVAVVRTEDKDNPVYKKIVKIYQSEAVRQFVINKYGGNVVPGF